jgi:hypothetical protein
MCVTFRTTARDAVLLACWQLEGLDVFSDSSIVGYLEARQAAGECGRVAVGGVNVGRCGGRGVPWTAMLKSSPCVGTVTGWCYATRRCDAWTGQGGGGTWRKRSCRCVCCRCSGNVPDSTLFPHPRSHRTWAPHQALLQLHQRRQQAYAAAAGEHSGRRRGPVRTGVVRWSARVGWARLLVRHCDKGPTLGS